MFPSLGYTNVFEFHPEVLSTTPLLWAVLALRERRVAATLALAALALLGKEDAALVVGAMALAALALPGRERIPLALGLAAMAPDRCCSRSDSRA
jgi:uncharacterized membrane protein